MRPLVFMQRLRKKEKEREEEEMKKEGEGERGRWESPKRSPNKTLKRLSKEREPLLQSA